MNQTQAIGKLRKVLGDRLAYRLDRKAAKAEARGEARVKAQEAAASKTAAEALRRERMDFLLGQDAEYQRLNDEVKELTKEHERLRSITLRAPITVGVDTGWSFSVRAEGDNWDEVVAKIESKV